jgi:alpha-1,3-glucan synthase
MDFPAFWIALICQLVIVWGYFWFYRKEQLGQSFSMKETYLESDMWVIQHDHKGLFSPSIFILGLS